MVHILFVSGFAHSWSTETHIARDASRIPGVTVEQMIEPVQMDGSWLVDLIERAEPADLVLYMKSRSQPPELADAWRMIEANGTITASVHLDLYRGLRRERDVGVDPMWLTQHVFTADGGSQDWFADRDVNHHWLPAACVSDEIVRAEPMPQYETDVLFVGQGANYPHPEYPFRAKLVAGLHDRYGDRFRHVQGVRDLALNSLYASAKVVVGDSVWWPGMTRFSSDRLYETLGRGGYLVYPRVGLPDMGFDEEDGCLLGYDPCDLNDAFRAVDLGLSEPDGWRKAVQLDNQGRIARHHTYMDRVRELLTVCGLPCE